MEKSNSFKSVQENKMPFFETSYSELYNIIEFHQKLYTLISFALYLISNSLIIKKISSQTPYMQNQNRKQPVWYSVLSSLTVQSSFSGSRPSVFNLVEHRANSRLAPSQWETELPCNAVSHWLGTSLESALEHIHYHQCDVGSQGTNQLLNPAQSIATTPWQTNCSTDNSIPGSFYRNTTAFSSNLIFHCHK